MFKKHTYSPNHKVVAGPHNYSPPAPAGGGPAGAPGGGMDASGGAAANFADGGDVPDIKGGGIRGKLDDYGTAIKSTFNDLTGSKSDSKSGNPRDLAAIVPGGDTVAERGPQLDKQIEDATK